MKARVAALSSAAVLAVASPCVAYYEGMVPHTYADPIGIPTICYGHTGTDVVPGRKATPMECQALLEQDLGEALRALDQCVRVPVEVHEAAALVSFTYNVGGRALCTSTLVLMLNAGAPPQRWCAQLSRWTKATVPVVRVKVELPGLVKRRASERAMCLGHVQAWRPA